MPAVRQRNSAIECLLIGSNMPDVSRSFVGPGIRVLGYVDDLARVFDQIRLTVAPLTFGAGVKAKVLESPAAGLPCACTSIAAEGLDFMETLEAMVGNGVEGLAHVVIKLHDDPVFNVQCRDAALTYTQQRLSESHVDGLMKIAIQTLKTSSFPHGVDGQITPDLFPPVTTPKRRITKTKKLS